MLDLDTFVDFQEIKVAIVIDDEFDRAGIGVMSHFGDAHGGFAHFLAQFPELVLDQGRGGFFDHFLVTALDGAIALTEVDDVAAVIAQNLELDMVRVLDVLLDIDAGVAKGFFRFGARRVVTLDEGDVVMSGTHPATAAAGDGFDHDRIADALGRGQRILFVFDQPVGARRRWHPGFLRQMHGWRLYPPARSWRGSLAR